MVFSSLLHPFTKTISQTTWCYIFDQSFLGQLQLILALTSSPLYGVSFSRTNCYGLLWHQSSAALIKMMKTSEIVSLQQSSNSHTFPFWRISFSSFPLPGQWTFYRTQHVVYIGQGVCWTLSWISQMRKKWRTPEIQGVGTLIAFRFPFTCLCCPWAAPSLVRVCVFMPTLINTGEEEPLLGWGHH